VNTYNRVDLLKRFIDDVQQKSTNDHVDFFVFDDASTHDYTPIKMHVVAYKKCKQHHGRERYWELIQHGIREIKKKSTNYDYFIKTDDDMLIVPNFFTLVKEYVKDISCDKSWVTLDILSVPRQRGRTLIGNPAEKKQGSHKYFRIQWVDMNFVFRPKLFPDEIGPCKSSKASSGVGLWLTRYFQKQKLNMYQTSQSLLLHGNHKSQMNREERKKHPLITKEDR
jgi:hypothetical protein